MGKFSTQMTLKPHDCPVRIPTSRRLPRWKPCAGEGPFRRPRRSASRCPCEQSLRPNAISKPGVHLPQGQGRHQVGVVRIGAVGNGQLHGGRLIHFSTDWTVRDLEPRCIRLWGPRLTGKRHSGGDERDGWSRAGRPTGGPSLMVPPAIGFTGRLRSELIAV